jgi:hypothetical protein
MSTSRGRCVLLRGSHSGRPDLSSSGLEMQGAWVEGSRHSPAELFVHARRRQEHNHLMTDRGDATTTKAYSKDTNLRTSRSRKMPSDCRSSFLA